MFESDVVSISLVIWSVSSARVSACYWNDQCSYGLFGSKTPYDAVRGDIRDYKTRPNCRAVSVWTLHRHGNRNPGTSDATGMREVAALKDEVIASYETGTSQLCAQDIENFKQWTWNDTIDRNLTYLTGIGYEEMYDIGKRLREKYPHLLQGTSDQFYFRSTNEQRSVTSCAAFVHGLTDGINLNLTVEDSLHQDDVIRPYEYCDRYLQYVKEGKTLADKLDSYFKSASYVAVQNPVQKRLGISTQLSTDNILSMYNLCRFYRSWTPNLQCPWCGVFTREELLVLEYYDDIRHYYRNGYGSWVNVNLGKTALKNLYENLEAVVLGGDRRLSSYFTHDTMMEMVYCAMGLYGADGPLQADVIDNTRHWRTSYLAVFSGNLIAVLNSCDGGDSQAFNVELFINENPTTLCPLEGCSWREFQNKFQKFTESDLSFCRLENAHEATFTS